MAAANSGRPARGIDGGCRAAPPRVRVAQRVGQIVGERSEGERLRPRVGIRRDHAQARLHGDEQPVVHLQPLELARTLVRLSQVVPGSAHHFRRMWREAQVLRLGSNPCERLGRLHWRQAARDAAALHDK